MGIRDRLAAHLPVFALEVRTPMLTLRFPDDDDLVDLAELAAEGVHDDDELPFTTPWTRVPSPQLERNTLEWFWTQRCTSQATAWHVTLATVVEGRVVGTQGLVTTDWTGTRSIETGSWLGRDQQGKGIGKEMRLAALHLVFDGFGAERATSDAFADNAASLGVTKALGYRPNGDELAARDGAPAVVERYVMTRDDFDTIRRDDIDVVGAHAVLDVFGTQKLPGAEPGS